jgi:hypothetical protein
MMVSWIKSFQFGETKVILLTLKKVRDLVIELSKSKTPAGKEYTSISTIMYDDPAPVHEDKAQADAWINDEMTWRTYILKNLLIILRRLLVVKLQNGIVIKVDMFI